MTVALFVVGFLAAHVALVVLALMLVRRARVASLPDVKEGRDVVGVVRDVGDEVNAQVFPFPALRDREDAA